jgi:hypothetical protein
VPAMLRRLMIASPVITCNRSGGNHAEWLR